MAKPLIFCLLFCLAGCFGGTLPAPVLEREQPASKRGMTHTVGPGETLYSIAWAYNMSVRGLAVTNGMTSPYTIFPGQKLVVAESSGRVKAPKTKTNTTIAKRTDRAISPAPVAKKTPPHKSQASSVSLDKNRYPFRWQWPAKGKLIRSYSSSSAVHKGIDIQGILGQPVRAANSGKVVYAGSGLVGYGLLLIIKHDDHYLSAYGHNSKLLVAEGDSIKVGQVIAKFGDSGTDSVKLHFEIRREGKPVDPLKLLPKV